jgi:hypothetical protein
MAMQTEILHRFSILGTGRHDRAVLYSYKDEVVPYLPLNLKNDACPTEKLNKLDRNVKAIDSQNV